MLGSNRWAFRKKIRARKLWLGRCKEVRSMGWCRWMCAAMVVFIIVHWLLMPPSRNAEVGVTVVTMSQTRFAEDFCLLRCLWMQIVSCVRGDIIHFRAAFLSFMDSRSVVILLHVELSLTPVRNVAFAVLSNDVPICLPNRLSIFNMSRLHQACHRRHGCSPVIVILPFHQLVPHIIVMGTF